MEVTAFHRKTGEFRARRSSLWPYSSPHGGRPLTGILLYGARTFLPRLAAGSDCPADFGQKCITLGRKTGNCGKKGTQIEGLCRDCGRGFWMSALRAIRDNLSEWTKVTAAARCQWQIAGSPLDWQAGLRGNTRAALQRW